MTIEEAGGGEIIATIMAALVGQAAAVEARAVGVTATAHTPEEEVAVASPAAIGVPVVSPGTTIGGTTTAGMTTAGAMTTGRTTAGVTHTRAGKRMSAAPGGIPLQRRPAAAGLQGTVRLRRGGGPAATWAGAPVAEWKVAQTGSGLRRPRGLWWLEGWKV